MGEWRARLGLTLLGLAVGVTLLEAGLWWCGAVHLGYHPAKTIIRIPIGQAVCFSSDVKEEMPLDMRRLEDRRFLMEQGKDWFAGRLDLSLEEVLEATPHCVLQRTGQREEGMAPHRESWVGVFGDSFAFGDGLPLERTVGWILAALDGTRNFVVFARPGSFASSLERQVESYLNSLAVHGKRSHHALYFYNLDDVLSPDPAPPEFAALSSLEPSSGEARFREKAGPLEGLLALSHTYWAIRHYVESRDITERTLELYRLLYDDSIPADGRILTRRCLRQARDRLARAGIQFHVVLYPLLYLDNRDQYPLEEVHRTVLEWCREDGIDCYDARPALLSGGDADRLIVHPRDRHPNGLANTRMARFVLASVLPEDD